MLTVLKIIAFELVAGVSANYDKNTSDGPWTCYKAVLRFQIWVRHMIRNLICLILMELEHERVAAQNWAVC